MFLSKSVTEVAEESSLYRRFILIGFALIILSVPLAFILPLEVSFENGLIEKLQVAVLIFGAVFNLRLCLSAKASRLKWFHGFCAALIMLLALRELSWGRVFFPIGINAEGAVFVSMSDWEYGVPVRIFRAVYIAVLVVVLVKFLPLKRLLLGRHPIALIALMLVAVAFNYIGEHGFIIGKAHGQVLEELNELIVYMNIPIGCLYYREKLLRRRES